MLKKLGSQALFILLITLLSIHAHAKIYSGVLKGYTKWQGEVFVEGDIVIPEDSVLVIMPGTKVTFLPARSSTDHVAKNFKNPEHTFGTVGKCDIFVYGSVRFLGNSKAPIILGNTAKDQFEKNVIGWGGIILMPEAQTVKISYAKFQFAEKALQITGNLKCEVDHCSFIGNKTGIETLEMSEPLILKNTFKSNNIGILVTDKSFPRIYYNTFIGNVEAAVKVTDIAYPVGNGNKFQANARDIWDLRNILYRE